MRTQPRISVRCRYWRATRAVRLTEQRLRGVQETWKLCGAGSVGSQALVGIPYRARRRFPQVDFRNRDLRHLERIESGAYNLVSMGYFLHGLSPAFRRFIDWIEGPNYPLFLAEDREQEFGEAGLRIDREGRVSDFGSYWLCTPSSRGSTGSGP